MKSLDKLQEKLVEFRSHLAKSNYGPKGGGQYDPVANQKRKSNNVEPVLEGPNKNSKLYTTLGSTMANQKDKALQSKNKRQPVKTMHPDTGEMVTVSPRQARAWDKVKKEKRLAQTNKPKDPTSKSDSPESTDREVLSLYQNGQWSLNKYGSAVTISDPGGTATGSPIGTLD